MPGRFTFEGLNFNSEECFKYCGMYSFLKFYFYIMYQILILIQETDSKIADSINFYGNK